MRSKTRGVIQRDQRTEGAKGEGLNWVLIVGGALLSTLSIRVACKIKQVLETKGSNEGIRGNKSTPKQRLKVCQLHSDLYKFTQDKNSCCHIISDGVQIKQVSNTPISEESDPSLPLVKIPAAALTRGSNASFTWPSSSELLELDSPSVSETGSDIYTKRDVINKLRRQLKRRDEMIMEMQNQITSLQNSLCMQSAQQVQMRAQLDSANQELFLSEQEILRLRNIVANHRIAKANTAETANGIGDLDSQRAKGNDERVASLKKEVCELRAAIELKDFLLRSYREQEGQRLESQQQDVF